MSTCGNSDSVDKYMVSMFGWTTYEEQVVHGPNPNNA